MPCGCGFGIVSAEWRLILVCINELKAIDKTSRRHDRFNAGGWYRLQAVDHVFPDDFFSPAPYAVHPGNPGHGLLSLHPFSDTLPPRHLCCQLLQHADSPLVHLRQMSVKGAVLKKLPLEIRMDFFQVGFVHSAPPANVVLGRNLRRCSALRRRLLLWFVSELASNA